MTLRCTLEIVPFGQEDLTHPIFRLDISNMGEIRNEGFGHVVCKYRVRIFRHLNETMRRLMKTDEEWEFQFEDYIPEHDRRDGAISLVQKATKLLEERA